MHFQATAVAIFMNSYHGYRFLSQSVHVTLLFPKCLFSVFFFYLCLILSGFWIHLLTDDLR